MSKRLDALVVREKDGKSFWTKIGAAFENRDGKGWMVKLDANPLDGVIHLREPLPARGAAAGSDADEDLPGGW